MHRATFLARINRFVALVRLGKEEIPVHLTNPDGLTILRPGLPCLLREAATPGRKTAYDLFSVEVDGVPVVVDSLAINHAAELYLRSPEQLLDPGKTLSVTPKGSIYDTRVDLNAYHMKGYWFIQVKGITWCEDGVGYYPDTASARTAKNIYNLLDLAYYGCTPALLFVTGREDIECIRPADSIDPDFALALDLAQIRGAPILGVCCGLRGEELVPLRNIPVILPSAKCMPS